MKKYEYEFIETNTKGFLRRETFQKEICEMAEKGWRFVSWIPRRQNIQGVETLILVFEREC